MDIGWSDKDGSLEAEIYTDGATLNAIINKML